ncbi:phosphatase PAP2 family protein [Dyadobacter fermentans]|uniref:Phosphoesterase PA-phosphatase related n=1 Tax=Dyadobacter fermentans (strain ATCC 700827 / DSM 18053 / CIP 107007 / KCTC 52180 / NS114) TaxID=471854 RepID=C6VZ79_DYAFD|nr:phosphatase PAP2 family protein [Dyadobacter fermentans]ACT91691.1 phosphoesterase PA-phosphatase related [Dyadobacter fermentans DSM 18053]
MTDAIQSIVRADQELFLWLNGLHTPWLDTLMYWITFKYTWIPLYILLITLTVRAEGWKKGGWVVLTVILAVVVADKITSGFMKPYFLRLRPCHDPTINTVMHHVTDCGGLYGFASSHASTSFALAVAWFGLLRNKVPQMAFLFVWALVYAYSRIYVGVHYPLDILVGGLVGALTGYCFVQLYYIFLKRYYLN